MKEDFEIVKLSDHRVAKRESTPIGIRFTDDERSAIKSVADEHGARSSDVIRCALSYVGVLPVKNKDQEEGGAENEHGL